jgi:hypothetical protein
VAHLDQDPSNNDPDNHVWLCLDHHDQFDSRTSQSKGLTEEEVRRHRERLYQHLAQQANQPSAKELSGRDATTSDFRVEISDYRPSGQKLTPGYYQLVRRDFRDKGEGTLFEFSFRIVNTGREAIALDHVKVVATVSNVRLEASERRVDQYVQTTRTQFYLRPEDLLRGGQSPQALPASATGPIRVALKTSQVIKDAPAELTALVVFTFLSGETQEVECRFVRRG